jgi:cation-transporting ATPase E
MLESSVEAPETPSPEVGLTSEEVRARAAAGHVNTLPNRTSRSVWDIVRANIFTWFNLILGVLFVFMITFGSWRDALFGSIVVINAVIGIAQEMRAKITLDRLSLLTASTARVVRDGTERDIPIAEIVIDEVVRLSPGDQIAADGDVLHSHGLEVDESLLTGESVPVLKSQGADVLSGSFVVAGAGLFQVNAVGDQAFAQRIAGEGRRYARMRSDLQDGINGFLKVVGLGIVPMAALLIWSRWRAGVSVSDGVTNTVAALVAMVPQGLVLLTSIAFAVSAVVLARRNVLVQELPAVEGLARTPMPRSLSTARPPN